MSAKIHIGTSGWNYKHWLGPFYPRGLPDKEMLSFYAKHFDSVEINNTFYHLPSFKTLKTWRETVPRKFTFAVKGSRFITHMKKLMAPKTSTKKFFIRAERLEGRLGPILFQLPPLVTFSSFAIRAGTPRRSTTYSSIITPHFASTISQAQNRR